jgi:hypothetical protein
MKAARAEVLRLMFPLLLRLATVDFLGTDDLVDFLEAERVEDDEREEWEDDRPPFCAITCNGNGRAVAISASPMRLIINVTSWPVAIIECSGGWLTATQTWNYRTPELHPLRAFAEPRPDR